MNGATYGVYLLAHRLGSAEAIVDVAHSAEELGFDCLWVGERVLHPGTVPDAPLDFDPLTVLSYLAARTSRIHLGTSTLILPYRHPLLLAKAIATLDQLSRGRVILGVGAGWLEPEFRALSVSFAERGSLCDEYIAAMKELWTSDAPEFHGRFCSFGPLTFRPKPLQEPYPPIWIAGNSERAMQRAVEMGDAWQPELGIEAMRTAARRLSDLARKRGRKPPLLAVGGELRLGLEDSASDREPLKGSAEQVASSVREYLEMGVRHFVLWIPAEAGTVIDQMELFAGQVWPQVLAGGR